MYTGINSTQIRPHFLSKGFVGTKCVVSEYFSMDRSARKDSERNLLRRTPMGTICQTICRNRASPREGRRCRWKQGLQTQHQMPAWRDETAAMAPAEVRIRLPSGEASRKPASGHLYTPRTTTAVHTGTGFVPRWAYLGLRGLARPAGVLSTHGILESVVVARVARAASIYATAGNRNHHSGRHPA